MVYEMAKSTSRNQRLETTRTVFFQGRFCSALEYISFPHQLAWVNPANYNQPDFSWVCHLVSGLKTRDWKLYLWPQHGRFYSSGETACCSPLHPNKCYREQAQIFYPALIIQLHDQGNVALFRPEWYTSLFLIDKNHICEVDLPAERKKKLKSWLLSVVRWGSYSTLVWFGMWQLCRVHFWN